MLAKRPVGDSSYDIVNASYQVVGHVEKRGYAWIATPRIGDAAPTRHRTLKGAFAAIELVYANAS